jgi:hypothetical protein
VRNSKPSADDLQPSPDVVDEKRSPKQFTIELFAWLNRIKADADLPPSAFKVAFEIGQYFNRTTGEAWPSTETIGRGIAMSQATVINMAGRLAAAGHLHIEPGRPGRGHSNRYRMLEKPTKFHVTKPQRAEVSKTGKTSGSATENLRTEQIKPQPADMNHKKNHKKNHQSNHQGAALRAASPVDRDVTPVTAVTAEDKARAFSALVELYPKQPSNGDGSHCRELLNRLIDAGGVDLEDMLDGAALHAGDCERKREQPKPLSYFLKVEGWKWENYHLMRNNRD